ncbi:MFS general substrate transporter [Trametes punicea]|nr:MFS general substrate transporter [Trametes punicea]
MVVAQEKSQEASAEKNAVLDSPIEWPPSKASPYSGRRGVLVVLGCFIFSAATVGWALFPLVLTVRLAWGVTEEYFRTHMFPGTADSVLTALGSLSSVPFLAAGALLWIASMLASAFCTEVWQFFITMGVMQGIADALVFPVIVALPAQWFTRYQGFATGVVVAGSSLGGAIASLIYREMLSAVGLRKSLVIFTAIDVVSLGAAYFMIEERQNEQERPELVWFDVEFFRDPVFWSVAGCFFFIVFGYLAPIFLISTFTVEKVSNLPELLAALPVVVLNLSAALGRTLVGFVADFFGPVNSLLVAIALSGLTQLVVWTFVSTYGGIMAFAILYGFFCGCFISLVSAVVARIYGADRLAGLSGLLLLFNTPGYAAGAPIAGAILGATGNDWRVVAGYGGAVQILGALCLVYARFKREPKVFAVY